MTSIDEKVIVAAQTKKPASSYNYKPLIGVALIFSLAAGFYYLANYKVNYTKSNTENNWDIVALNYKLKYDNYTFPSR